MLKGQIHEVSALGRAEAWTNGHSDRVKDWEEQEHLPMGTCNRETGAEVGSFGERPWLEQRSWVQRKREGQRASAGGGWGPAVGRCWVSRALKAVVRILVLTVRTRSY